jgi:hypothetical protein
MNNLETERLNDFKKILTYHLVKKIKHHFKSNYNLYYYAPKLWQQWRNHKLKYEHKIYDLINKFNQTSLSAKQVQSIFGKDESNKKWIAYKNILESDADIKIFNKGTICENDQRYQIKNRYQLPYEYIKSIFENKELLEKVCDAESDFYSDRQRRLIFSQINKQQKYHYKTKKEIAELLTDEEMIAAIINDI